MKQIRSVACGCGGSRTLNATALGRFELPALAGCCWTLAAAAAYAAVAAEGCSEPCMRTVETCGGLSEDTIEAVSVWLLAAPADSVERGMHLKVEPPRTNGVHRPCEEEPMLCKQLRVSRGMVGGREAAEEGVGEGSVAEEGAREGARGGAR
eukprot:CAMPEP_0174727760 /NCGR_PEP_ID=MMETSP1094-20130205/50441_1 /TAXON_ID=156173 /ORGANISM="Chrysochromulina brevifilum, Strain UTEX LB 985" /LENGTH=151 /DNA_ID=CAMNT_0015929575 /DNA_START=250 /DNA_END=703 /DNA_ORIENTATION=+